MVLRLLFFSFLARKNGPYTISLSKKVDICSVQSLNGVLHQFHYMCNGVNKLCPTFRFYMADSSNGFLLRPIPSIFCRHPVCNFHNSDVCSREEKILAHTGHRSSHSVPDGVGADPRYRQTHLALYPTQLAWSWNIWKGVIRCNWSCNFIRSLRFTE